MNNNIQDIIDHLNDIKKEVRTNNNFVLRTQINLLERITSRFFKKSSYREYVDDADEINENIISSGTEYQDNTNNDIKSLLNTVIENMIKELTKFGLPSKDDHILDKSSNSVVIHNNPTFTQSQIVNIGLIKDILQDVLTGKQFKELQKVVTNEPDMEKAAPKLLDKIKSFGGDVASNIVAGILTNPDIYSGLF